MNCALLSACFCGLFSPLPTHDSTTPTIKKQEFIQLLQDQDPAPLTTCLSECKLPKKWQKWPLDCLQDLIKQGRLDILKLLIEQQNLNLNYLLTDDSDPKQQVKRPLLHHAILQGQVPIVNYLLQKGAAVHTIIGDYSGITLAANYFFNGTDDYEIRSQILQTFLAHPPFELYRGYFPYSVTFTDCCDICKNCRFKCTFDTICEDCLACKVCRRIICYPGGKVEGFSKSSSSKTIGAKNIFLGRTLSVVIYPYVPDVVDTQKGEIFITQESQETYSILLEVLIAQRYLAQTHKGKTRPFTSQDYHSGKQMLVQGYCRRHVTTYSIDPMASIIVRYLSLPLNLKKLKLNPVLAYAPLYRRSANFLKPLYAQT